MRVTARPSVGNHCHISVRRIDGTTPPFSPLPVRTRVIHQIRPDVNRLHRPMLRTSRSLPAIDHQRSYRCTTPPLAMIMARGWRRGVYEVYTG
jgi:hypothetical protein